MLAVYARVVGLPNFDLPPELQPIALEDAADILRRDAATSAAGESRRVRSIVRLTVAGLELGPAATFTHRYRAFLERVGAPIPTIDAVIRDQLNAPILEPGRPLEPGREDFSIEPGRPGGDSRLTDELFHALETPAGVQFAQGGGVISDDDLFDLLEPATAGCSAKIVPPPSSMPTPASCNSDTSNAVYVPVAVDVTGANLEDLAVSLDPQSWDEWDVHGKNCNPFFTTACALTPDRSSCDDCPETPGTDWSGYFYEILEMNFPKSALYHPGSRSAFKVILGVGTDAAPGSYRADFCLAQSIGIQIGNNFSAKIVIDEGFTQVVPDGGGHQIMAEKFLQFSDAVDHNGHSIDKELNWAAKVLLLAMGEGLKEQACCAVTTAPICTP